MLDQYIKKYYDINNYIKDIEKLGIKVVVCDTNIPFKSSYSQYLYAYNKYSNFDHYIIMEDDWVPYPTANNFDNILLNIYKKKSQYQGFLSAWVCTIFNHPPHSAISVGIISNNSFKKISKQFSKHFSKQFNINHLGQRDFSRLFEDCSLPLVDYVNNGKTFMNPFWETKYGVIYEYALTLASKYLLVPIQLLKLKKYPYMLGNWKLHSATPPSKEVIRWASMLSGATPPPAAPRAREGRSGRFLLQRRDRRAPSRSTGGADV